MSGDLIYFIQWWSIFFILGLVSLPLSCILFRRFIDLGYGFAKTIGLLVVSYIAFILSISHLVPLTNTCLYLILSTYALINVYIYRRSKQKIDSQIRKNLKMLIAQEILFTVGLFFWSYIRAYQPDIRGLEKFMDFGFINSILKTKYLPPIDMWFSGKPINYYWFGHLTVAVATKISRIPSTITYNLMLATILGITLASSFSIMATLVKKVNKKQAIKTAVSAGIISAVLLAFGGSLHTPIYVLKDGPKNYWYPDATRFIGYHPETNDKTIHEFPIYSFVVSDLHPHLLNLPFVLLYLAILFNYTAIIKPDEKTTSGRLNSIFGFRIFPSKIFPLGFLLGIMFMTNTWDFGNYLLVTGVTMGLFNLIKRGFSLKTLLKTGIALGAIFVLALIIAFPFILNFDSIAQGVRLINSHTPLWQLGVLWGFPAILTAIFIFVIKRFHTNIKRVKRSDLFIVSLLTASWILIALPEIIYVKDIYIASHYRANTMFKLTYQAYVMFYLSSGYIAIRSLRLINKLKFKIFLFSFYALIFGSVLIYPSFAIKSYYGSLRNYRGLSGDSWLEIQYPNEFVVVKWFKENVKNQPVILEAPGDSYTDFNVISSYTGLPTVSGWFVHEWLWRGDSSFPQERVTDITQIYTSKDISLIKELLNKYKVKYVIIGTFERQKYPNLYEGKFSQLGNLVFSSGITKIYQVN